MMGFCSSGEFFFLSFFFLILIFKTYYYFYTFIPLFDFPTLLFPLQLIFNVYKPSSTFSFFPSLSTYFLVLFSLFYSPIGSSFKFCFPVCALVSFAQVDVIFGFLCLPGQSIVLYFCWTVLILLMGVYVYNHTFHCCHKPVPLHWASAVLWSFPFLFILPFFFFSHFITLTFNFLNLLYLFYIYSFVCLS